MKYHSRYIPNIHTSDIAQGLFLYRGRQYVFCILLVCNTHPRGFAWSPCALRHSFAILPLHPERFSWPLCMQSPSQAPVLRCSIRSAWPCAWYGFCAIAAQFEFCVFAAGCVSLLHVLLVFVCLCAAFFCSCAGCLHSVRPGSSFLLFSLSVVFARYVFFFVHAGCRCTVSPSPKRDALCTLGAQTDPIPMGPSSKRAIPHVVGARISKLILSFWAR